MPAIPRLPYALPFAVPQSSSISGKGKSRFRHQGHDGVRHQQSGNRRDLPIRKPLHVKDDGREDARNINYFNWKRGAAPARRYRRLANDNIKRSSRTRRRLPPRVLMRRATRAYECGARELVDKSRLVGTPQEAIERVGEAGSFRPEFEVNLCEECWDRVKLAFATCFKHGAGGNS